MSTAICYNVGIFGIGYVGLFEPPGINALMQCSLSVRSLSVQSQQGGSRERRQQQSTAAL